MTSGESYLVVDEAGILKETISAFALDRFMVSSNAPYLPRVDVLQVEGVPGELGRTVGLPLHEEAVLIACAAELNQYERFSCIC